MFKNLEEYLNVSFSLSKFRNHAICSSYYFQDNMLYVYMSGTPSPWRQVLFLGNVSVEKSLEANWSTSLTFPSLRHSCSEAGRDDEKQYSNLILEATFNLWLLIVYLLLFILLLFIRLYPSSLSP